MSECFHSPSDDACARRPPPRPPRTQCFFELSSQELRFAEEHGEKVHFFRISGVILDRTSTAASDDDGPPPRLVRFTNPAALWRSGRLELCVVF